jgi:hypothetical protein
VTVSTPTATAGEETATIATLLAGIIWKSVESPAVPNPEMMQLTEAFAAPAAAVGGIVTVVLAAAGTVVEPPLRLRDLEAIGGMEPGGLVTVNVQGVEGNDPAAAINTVKLATPPTGTESGETAAPTSELMRKEVEPVAPPQLADAIACPTGVRPGTSIWMLKELTPDAGAGLVAVEGEVAVTVPEPARESVTVQEAVAPDARPATVPEIKTAVCRLAFVGTGTTVGEIVIEGTVTASTGRTGVKASAGRMTAMSAASRITPRMANLLQAEQGWEAALAIIGRQCSAQLC